jgi:hypothetical protein
MIRRGWGATDLARESRLSQATISSALAGRPIAEKSLALIAKALSRALVLDVVDAMVGPQAFGTEHALIRPQIHCTVAQPSIGTTSTSSKSIE